MRQRFDERPQEKAVSVGVGVMYTTICYNIVELEDGTWEADVVTIETTGGEPTDEQVLVAIKQDRLAALEAYDASDAVNGFDVTIGGQTMSFWIDRETRADYKSSIEAAELLGRTEVKPVFGGQEVTLDIQMAKMALAQVQIYANQCFGVTQQHKAAIEALLTVQDVEDYDFTAGYPPRLSFSV